MRQGHANDNVLRDPLACAVARGWGGAVIEALPVTLALEQGWLVERVGPAGKPTRVVTGVDGERFSRLRLDTAARGA